MSTLLSVSIAVLAGLLMTRVFNLWRLPDVTAYLVAGVLIGPYVLGSMHITGLGLVSAEAVSSLHLVSEVALGFIAFSIGNEFRLEDLKSTGNQAAIIGVVQALTATLLVDTALLTVHMLLPEKLSAAQAITLGAIATATAPAATLMVVRQYKAKGPVTNLLLPIVALDDAVGLIVFAVSFGISKALVSGELDLISILLNPLLEIVASLALGAAAGWLLTKLEVLFHSNTNRLNMTISLVFLTVALSMSHITLGPVTISFSWHPTSCTRRQSLSPFCAVLRHQRRGVGVGRLYGLGHRVHWSGLYPVPLCRQIYRCLCQLQIYEMRTGDL